MGHKRDCCEKATPERIRGKVTPAPAQDLSNMMQGMVNAAVKEQQTVIVPVIPFGASTLGVLAPPDPVTGTRVCYDVGFAPEGFPVVINADEVGNDKLSFAAPRDGTLTKLCVTVDPSFFIPPDESIEATIVINGLAGPGRFTFTPTCLTVALPLPHPLNPLDRIYVACIECDVPVVEGQRIALRICHSVAGQFTILPGQLIVSGGVTFV